MNNIIAEIKAERATLMALLQRLDDATINQQGLVGVWSIKNVLAHLVGWDEWLLRTLAARLTTGRLPDALRAATDDEDRWNAEQVAQRASMTPREQIDELERARESLLAYLATLDEARFDQPEPWPGSKPTLREYLRISVRDHDAAHRREIEAALQASRQA